MTKQAYLILEDKTVYEGLSFGAQSTAVGEVVFNTSMTGYQEMLTDPSYAGQIVVPTYPLIGNYGINGEDVESSRVQVAGFVVRHHCPHPSNPLSTSGVHDYLASQRIPGICNVDTRSITTRLRSAGVMMGILTSEMAPQEALARLQELPKYDSMDYVSSVSTKQGYKWQAPDPQPQDSFRIIVTDCGLKFNILRLLRSRGCAVAVVPATSSAEEILAMKPQGLVFSPGPGDPALLDYAVTTLQGLVGRVPIMGICLGHQLIARAMGGRTFKLKFGHRGGNHPVRDLATGRVNITAQNHGYAVDPDSLPPGLEVSHINLNDNTVEGLRHKEIPILSIQYHSEGSPGPRDNEYLFDRFLELVREGGRS